MVVVVVGLIGSGCTTLLYKGPTRSASEVAVITSIDTIVDKVDDVMVRDSAMGSFAQLEVLPGPHRLWVSLNHVAFAGVRLSGGHFVICAELQAGRTYQTRPGDRLAPILVDLRTDKVVDPRCRRPGPKPQAGVAAAPGSQATAKTQPAQEAPPPDASASGELVAAAGSESQTPPPTPTPAPAVDTEEPPMEVRESERWERLPSDAQLANRPPGSGISFILGLGFGGEDFVSATDSNGNTDTLSAGTGGMLGIGLMFTPLWIAESIGLGVAADASIKYDWISADNGSASITRYPISLTAHFMAGSGNHFLILKGGAIKDFGVNYSASGFTMLDANISGTWGPIGAIGYYKRSTDFYGWDILGYFALNNHVAGGQTIDAHSIGILCGMHWRPF